MKCELNNLAYKIVVDKKKLLHMVSVASLLTNKKSTEILFTCLCVEITHQNIVIKSTNGISCCMITEDYNSNNQNNQWCFMIHGINFCKILKQLDDQFISIEDNTKNNVIIIKNQTGTDCFTLDKIAYKDQTAQFPQLDKPICSINAEYLKNLINQTSLNVLEERGGKIAIKLDNQQAQLIVYDNTRISWATINKAINPATEEKDPLLLEIHIDVPSRQYLYKILLGAKQLDYQISMGYSVCKKFIFWSYNDSTFFCKIINTPLLNYNTFIPSHQNFITINTKEFIKALQKVAVVISEINYAVSLTPKQNGELLISSNNPANGAQSSIIIQYSGQKVNNFVKLNIKYLLEALKTIEEDTINLSILSHNKPIYIRTQTTNHIMMSIAHIE